MHTVQSSSLGASDLRKFIKCVDGVFDEMVKEHINLEKYYSEYKILAKKTNVELDGCEKKDTPESKKE